VAGRQLDWVDASRSSTSNSRLPRTCSAHKKEGRGQVGPEPVAGVDLANRVVQMCAEVLSAFVLVEERREDAERKSLSMLLHIADVLPRDQVRPLSSSSLST
jgi:hypothetical protein